MQSDAGQSTVTDQYPPPPLQYAQLYTNENIESGRAPAPPPPICGHYTLFGEPCNTEEPITQSLESLGIQQLYTSGGDRRVQLKRLLHSVVVAFLDLIEILVRAPESMERQKKLEDIRIIFINMHHLINEYRPVQARETVQLMLELQKTDRIEMATRFRAHMNTINNMLRDCVNNIPSRVELGLPPQQEQHGDSMDTSGASTTEQEDTTIDGQQSDDKLVEQSVKHKRARARKYPKIDQVMCNLVDKRK